jgi:4-hydroxysphinganine ceramide fatty acyl 2-hydroxylase
MSKRIRIYTANDVAAHTNPGSCWVSRADKVYDVSAFLSDHPGGEDLILAHAGKDIEEVMKDRLEHEHSESAYSMLDEYVIGRLGTKESIVRDGSWQSPSPLLYNLRSYFGVDWEAPDDFHPDTTDSIQDYEKNAFLDLSKPLLRQVWEANFRCVAQVSGCQPEPLILLFRTANHTIFSRCTSLVT